MQQTRMFGLGTIEIACAGTDKAEVILCGIKNSKSVADILRKGMKK